MVSAGKDFNILAFSIFIGLFSSGICDVYVDQTEDCSFHSFATCDDRATCVDVQGVGVDCQCPTGSDGDGFKGEGKTGCGPPKCKFDIDCHTLAVCNADHDCECLPNYSGDGIMECKDNNECLDHPCHSKAMCQNNEGSFTCTCNSTLGYEGDGFNCTHRCTMDHECGANKICVGKVCVCAPGFTETDKDGCVDENECITYAPCDVNATCENNVGSFWCTCKNGYVGDGLAGTCDERPKNCHEIKLAKPNTGSGMYTIDADGSGPLEAIEVECEMRIGLGITIVKPLKENAISKTNTYPNTDYIYKQTLPNIKAIINTAGYCYQDMKYKCQYGAVLMDGNDWWINGNNEKEENWGGASTNGKCACGELGYCANRASSCNCNGTTDKMFDSGKIIDKTKLPILTVYSEPGAVGRGFVTIGPVMCAPKPFDIPLDCNDAKYNKYYLYKTDGPQVLDFDGPDGELPPVMVHCDMETYKHAGVTVIPTLGKTPLVPTEAGTTPVPYVIDENQLEALITRSNFCQQDARIDCKKSRIMNGGDKKAYFSDLSGVPKNYWAGGMGLENQCGCGVTKKCDTPDVSCNCDVYDDEWRYDFGKVIDKEDLPIASVTVSDIGGGSEANVTVGPLMCGFREFGIPASCMDYVYLDYTESYTYIVDPDGPFNPAKPSKGTQPPFPVYCEISGYPLYATTIVYHDTEQQTVTSNGVIGFTYRQVSNEQIEALTTRAVTCTQTTKYTCKQAKLHAEGSSLTTWETVDGRVFSYFDGTGEVDGVCACGLTDPSTCDTDDVTCNCDKGDDIERMDEGILLNKDDLPIISVNFTAITGASTATIEVGPLMCRDIFPNCAKHKIYNTWNRLESEYSTPNGFYAIDPDGQVGEPPFIVECIGTKTIVSVTVVPTTSPGTDPDKPVSACYNVTYGGYGGDSSPATPQQVQALVASSPHCAQQLSEDCQNAPLTGYSNFSTCDGVAQPGWAGGLGKPKCACGVTGSCAGGSEAACNCDLVDGSWQQDRSWMMMKSRLAVCEICVGLDPTSSIPVDVTPQERKVLPTVSDLFCDIGPVGKAGSCQEWRNQGQVDSGTQMIDPDGSGPIDAGPFFCRMMVYPPIGWTEIYPKEPVIEIPLIGIEIVIEYYVYSMEIMVAMIEGSGYCTQSLHLDCQDSSLDVTGEFGWYSRDGVVQNYWAGNEAGTKGCKDEQCQCNLDGFRTDGGDIIDDELLPVTTVNLGPAPGTRTLRVGPVKCFDIYRDCEEIHVAKAKKNPLGNHTYVIDPDQAGGVPFFPVVCDFKSVKGIGITKIPVIKPSSTLVQYPAGRNDTIIYDGATPSQINALTQISGYCHQGIQYTCKNSPIINNNDPLASYYKTYGGVPSLSFGVAGSPDVVGCACMATHTCPEGHSCHCDAMGPMTVDYGHETNRDTLPIEQVIFGGQPSSASSAAYDISDVVCAPIPVDLPEDCDDARQRRFYTGEILIWPSTEVEPFLVYCDMELVPGKGVTIIGNNFEEGVPITFGVLTEVTYRNADKPQIDALTGVSQFCYQPFKYECQNTKMLEGEGYFYWTGPDSEVPQTYVGDGRPFVGECNCGKKGYCGGDGDVDTLTALNRPCNCDNGDGVPRLDAGVFNSSQLPITEVYFKDSGLVNQSGILTLGKLYCSKTDFDINECTTGFHDCDEHARCINQHGYFDCRCKPGWTGIKNPDVWANGRNCYDDNECEDRRCPWNSNCTNNPGSFVCSCHEGYRQTGKTRCDDIDECLEKSNDCDGNARCINLMGSYDCKCKRGFKGNGTSCERQAVCSCFGDPHCITSDGQIVDYQGDCEYIMSRDNCYNLSDEPTYELLISNERRDTDIHGDVAWVKEATFSIYNYTIQLRQGLEIFVDGYKKTPPYYDPRRLISIREFGSKYVQIYTELGVEVMWDGDEAIEIYTPGQFMGRTCGFCGNFNGDPDDDLTVGPGCTDTEGQVTDNDNLFGESWVNPENPECTPNCSITPDPGLCDGIKLQIATLSCNKVFDERGFFKDCFVIMNMDNENTYGQLYRSCQYDLCHTEGDVSIALCASAANLFDMCTKSYQVAIETFRTEDFCSVNCAENMEYNVCGSINQPSCFDFRNDSISNLPSPRCEEGCFCKEGFMKDGQKCVEQEDCGCIYKNDYLMVGETKVFDTCVTGATCQKGGEMTYDNITCHENATCSLQEGVYGCHCKKGLLGDGIINCVDDPCSRTPCGVNETCVINATAAVGYTCGCQMGFMGECGNCVEIDECLTATDTCPARANCINTVGAYRCECEEGYIMYDGECQDFNECIAEKLFGTAVCGNNSRCHNEIGGFTCPCCHGYEKDANGDCVESSSSENSESVQCCVCDIGLCNTKGKVCGEDGVQYDSMKDMIIARCEEGMSPMQQNDVDYFGKCQATCSENLCPEYQKCVVHAKTNKPTCVCEPCTAEESESPPVCTSKLDTYPNLCTFKKIQCMLDVEATPSFDMKPCDDKGSGSPVGSWGDWGTCSVSCGKGVATRERTAYRPLTAEELERRPLTQTTECYEDPCPDGPCYEFECGNIAEECVVNDAGEAECECPTCNDAVIDPVCGFVTGTVQGDQEGTWKSSCDLQRFVCDKRLDDYEYMHDGPCGTEPLNCTRVPNPQYIVEDDGYQSPVPVDRFECQGGCGRLKNDCCRSSDQETRQVRLVDTQGQEKMVDRTFIKKCECVDISDELEAP